MTSFFVYTGSNYETAINFILPLNLKFKCESEYTEYLRGTNYLLVIYQTFILIRIRPNSLWQTEYRNYLGITNLALYKKEIDQAFVLKTFHFWILCMCLPRKVKIIENSDSSFSLRFQLFWGDSYTVFKSERFWERMLGLFNFCRELG